MTLELIIYAPVTLDLILSVAVDMRTGRPCVDYLDNLELWRPAFSLSALLVTLQVIMIIKM